MDFLKRAKPEKLADLMLERFLNPKMIRESADALTRAVMTCCDHPEFLRSVDQSLGKGQSTITRESVYRSLYDGLVYTHLYFIQGELASASESIKRIDNTLGTTGSKASMSRVFEEALATLAEEVTVADLSMAHSSHLTVHAYADYRAKLDRFYEFSEEFDAEWGFARYRSAFGAEVHEIGGVNFGVQDLLIKCTGIRDFDVHLLGQYARYWNALRLELMEYLVQVKNGLMKQIVVRRR